MLIYLVIIFGSNSLVMYFIFNMHPDEPSRSFKAREQWFCPHQSQSLFSYTFGPVRLRTTLYQPDNEQWNENCHCSFPGYIYAVRASMTCSIIMQCYKFILTRAVIERYMCSEWRIHALVCITPGCLVIHNISLTM